MVHEVVYTNFGWWQKKKEVLDKLKALCMSRSEHQFDETKKELDKLLKKESKLWIDEQMKNKSMLALAFDKGGCEYDIMTTNAFESFNNVFWGIRSFHVFSIVDFSLLKCNAYFVN